MPLERAGTVQRQDEKAERKREHKRGRKGKEHQEFTSYEW